MAREQPWHVARSTVPPVALALVLGLVVAGGQSSAQPTRSGNPVLQGWYADPEAHLFGDSYWIYPTTSAPYDDQTYMDAFSSPDLVTWTRHPHILDLENVSWGSRALWAPSVVEADGWYYLFFSANDIQNDEEEGGIGVARARSPDGPFHDYLGEPLIGRFHNGAQPIDPFVFRDTDGTYYLTYGGWRHCNIARLNADFTGFVPFDDGSTFREITPEGYVEAPPRTTQWRTPSPPLPQAPSGGSAPSSSRTREWPRAPATTPCCTPRGPTGGTSSTTGARLARPTETTAWSVSTSSDSGRTEASFR
jgi:hypothetical protein